MSPGRHSVAWFAPPVLGLAVLIALDAAFILSRLQASAYWAITAGIALILAVISPSTRIRTVNIAVFLLLALVGSRIDWTVDKRFVRTLQRVEPGMTEESVRHIMADFTEGTGWPENPNVPHAGGEPSNRQLELVDQLVFRPTSEPGDSNWGMVRFGADRRVVSVEFSSD